MTDSSDYIIDNFSYSLNIFLSFEFYLQQMMKFNALKSFSFVLDSLLFLSMFWLVSYNSLQFDTFIIMSVLKYLAKNFLNVLLI